MYSWNDDDFSELEMGVTHLTALVRNPAEPDRSWEGLFLVDTGAIDSLASRPCLGSIALMPKGQRVYGLTDGTEVRLDITTGDIEFTGEIVGSTIVFGEADAEPLLGVTALESVGIAVDPRNQSLKSSQPRVSRGFNREPNNQR